MDLEMLEEELASILESDFKVEVDARGQVVIHTGLMANNDGELIPFEALDDLSGEYDDSDDEDDYDMIDDSDSFDS